MSIHRTHPDLVSAYTSEPSFTLGATLSDASGVHYQVPGWFTRTVFNKMVIGLTRVGVSVAGSRILEVRGRKSGELRRTPVNLLTLDGEAYLVSPRGEGQWVRNVRASNGQLELLVGRRRTAYSAHEVPDSEKVAILRAYLKRWKAEVGIFFGGVGPDSPDDAIAAIAHKHPVFNLQVS
jgi:deazaflavin-dependent oxidoreductase (nitroreductase family)